MRSLEYLIQLYPNATGAELLAIQNQDKEDERRIQMECDAKLLTVIEDINTNGGYYKGRFGNDQRYFYKITNAVFMHNDIFVDVEKIVVFLGDGNSVVRKNEISIDLKQNEYVKLSIYDIDNCIRISKDEYDEAETYLRNVAKFWNDIVVDDVIDSIDDLPF